MNAHPVYPKVVLGWIILALIGAFSARTASNTLPPTRLKEYAFPIADSAKPELFKPSECAGLALTNLVVGSGNITDGAANSLILGSELADTIQGGAGNDCIVAGAGNDTIYGDQASLPWFSTGGNDVILGGPDNDTILGDGAMSLLTQGGNDLLLGQDGDDQLDGDGPPGLFSTGGTDDCRGGGGNNTFIRCESQSN